MVPYFEKNGRENSKVIIGKLIDKAHSPVGPIISAFDISLTRSANVQRLDKFTVVQLENCADFLGIALVDKDSSKIFTKSALATRIYLGFMALMPAKCGECGDDYVIDHEPETAPFFHCFGCFKGSHNCERNRLLHQTLSAMNTPKSFVWLCDTCQAMVDPLEPWKKRSHHASGALSSLENQLSDIANSSSDISNLPLKCAPTQHPIPTAPSPPSNVCRRFLNWNCPHGISGKKEIDGKCCPFTHLRVCNQFRISGSTGKRGCKKGAKCAFFHPNICKTTLESGSCSETNCTMFHPRAPGKKSSSGSYNSSHHMAQMAKQTDTDTTSTSSSDCVELRNLVTEMAGKLEMLEKKMEQGAPECQPALQQASDPHIPPIIYPTASLPPHMMHLGVSMLPYYPTPFSQPTYY